jgi:predicted outer membrane repeat protein
LMLCVLWTQRASAAGPIFVTPAGNGGGTSFADATNLPHALAIVHAGDQIWAASGIYVPGTSASDTFSLTSGVALYGGFPLTATQMSQRDWATNPTVLSGDLGGDDTTDGHGVVTDTNNIRGANSYHVVTADGTKTLINGTTRLDGFTITAGDATASSNSNGAGFYCNGESGTCSPHLENDAFSGNLAVNGAAMYNEGEKNGASNPTYVNVAFTGNKASGGGGAVYNDGNSGVDGNAETSSKSSPTFDNVSFSNNSAGTFGGAVYNNGEEGTSSPSFVQALFTNNKSNTGGGALYNDCETGGQCNPSFVAANFTDNEAGKGGAIDNDASGGGTSSPTYVNVLFYDNVAGSGGAIYNDGSNGGINRPKLVNVTFSLNNTTVGGAITNDGTTGTSATTFANTIFWDNAADTASAQILNIAANITFTTSLVQGGIHGSGIVNENSATVIDGGGNLSADPLFVNEAGVNVRLKSGSPAIDKGSNSAISQSTDLDGKPRKTDGNGDGAVVVDLGAYESAAAPTHTVTLTFADDGSGQVGSTPARTPCAASCTLVYPVGVSVSLHFTPTVGSAFDGWSGACSGTGACTLKMSSNKNVTATFIKQNGPGNDAPGFTSTPELTGTVGLLYTYSITAVDPDAGDTLTITAPLKPAWLTLTPTGNGTATLSGTPGSANVGENAVQLRVQDGGGLFDTQSFTITVAAANPDTTGSVKGKVVDEANHGLAGATLTLTNKAGAVVVAALLNQTTDNLGNYLFEGVPAGDYTLTASLAGKEDSALQSVTVNAGKTTTAATITLKAIKPLLHLPLLDKAQ